jgi:hypothetical protein
MFISGDVLALTIWGWGKKRCYWHQERPRMPLHHTMDRTLPQQRIMWSRMSVGPVLRNLVLEAFPNFKAQEKYVLCDNPTHTHS